MGACASHSTLQHASLVGLGIPLVFPPVCPQSLDGCLTKAAAPQKHTEGMTRSLGAKERTKQHQA